MRTKLALQALLKFAAGVLLVALLLFGCAGTLGYPNGWLLMAVLFLPMALLGAVLLVKAPDLLQKRLAAKEQQGQQRAVVTGSALLFLAGFAAAGLQARFSWQLLPFGISIGAAVVFLLGYALYAEVLRENRYLSRTVEVQESQQVVDTGLYGIVRHPMYTATILMFLAIPLILGSWVGFVILLWYPLLLVRRIRGEEALLTAELAGYAAYRERVRYRLLPYLW